MAELEKSMQDLYNLFSELAVLIEEQGVSVDNIYNNVVNTEAYVQKANDDIRQAVIYQTSARKKKICLLVSCIVAITLAVLITLWQLDVFVDNAPAIVDAAVPGR